MQYRRLSLLQCIATVAIITALAWLLPQVFHTNRVDHTAIPAGDAHNDRESDLLKVRFIRRSEEIGRIAQSARAVAFIDFIISVPARRNLQHYLYGIESLSRWDSELNIDFFIVDYRAQDWCKEWLSRFPDDRIQDEGESGNGFVLWLEHGRVLRVLGGREFEGSDGIEQITLQVWPKDLGNP